MLIRCKQIRIALFFISITTFKLPKQHTICTSEMKLDLPFSLSYKENKFDNCRLTLHYWFCFNFKITSIVHAFKAVYINPILLKITITCAPWILTASPSIIDKILFLRKWSFWMLYVFFTMYIHRAGSDGCKENSHKKAGNLCGYTYQKKGVFFLLLPISCLFSETSNSSFFKCYHWRFYSILFWQGGGVKFQ